MPARADVDPVSHVLFGAVAVTAVRPQPLRPLVLTAAVTSLLPDLDAVIMAAGWDRYLLVHEIGCHSLLGAAVLAMLAALLVRRRVPVRFPIICAAALAGSLGHVAWDVASGADIRLFWPVSATRVGAHLVAMADPFVAAILVTGAACALVWRRHTHVIAAATLLTLAGLLCGKAWLQQQVRSVYRAEASRDGEAVLATAQDARWGSLTEFRVYDRTRSRLRTWHADAWTGRAMLLFERRIPAADPRIEASRSMPTARHALALFDLPFAEVRPLNTGGYEVGWCDIRFCHANGECDLWFGAEYAANGSPVQQVVRVGTLVQTRPVPPP